MLLYIDKNNISITYLMVGNFKFLLTANIKWLKSLWKVNATPLYHKAIDVGYWIVSQLSKFYIKL